MIYYHSKQSIKMFTQCYGEVVNKNSKNYGKRCSIYCDSCYCAYHEFQRNDKSICVNTIKNLLNLCENTSGRENKIKISQEIYNFILNNVSFVNEFEKFKSSVLNKLDDLDREGWCEAKTIKKKLLHELEKINNPSD